MEDKLDFTALAQLAKEDAISVRSNYHAEDAVNSGVLLASTLTDTIDGLDLHTAAAVLELLGNTLGAVSSEVMDEKDFDPDMTEKIMYANILSASYVIAADELFTKAAGA